MYGCGGSRGNNRRIFTPQKKLASDKKSPADILRGRRRESKALESALKPSNWGSSRELTFVNEEFICYTGHPCGYLRVDKSLGRSLAYDLKEQAYLGRCALTQNICSSCPQQDAYGCRVFQRALEKWMKEDARRREKYERVEGILPVSEND